MCNRSCRLMAGGRKPGAAVCDVPGSVVLFNMTRLPVSLFIFKKIRYFSDFYRRSFLETSAKTLFPITFAEPAKLAVVIPECQHSVLPSHTVWIILQARPCSFLFAKLLPPMVSCTAGTGKAGTRVRSSGPFSCPSLLSICYTLVSCLSVIPQPNSSLPAS